MNQEVIEGRQESLNAKMTFCPKPSAIKVQKQEREGSSLWAAVCHSVGQWARERHAPGITPRCHER